MSSEKCFCSFALGETSAKLHGLGINIGENSLSLQEQYLNIYIDHCQQPINISLTLDLVQQRLGLNFRLVVNNALGLKSLIFCKSSQLARCLMIAVFIPK